MNRKTRGMSLAIVVALLIPILAIGIQNITEQPSIWIVYAESPDESMMLAAQTFRKEMTSTGCSVGITVLDRLDIVPLNSEAIALVGHGHLDGVEVRETLVPWEQVINRLTDLHPQTIMLLACDSPSNIDAGIFGFTGQIDAEAGGLLSAWKVLQKISSDATKRVPLEQAVEAQMKMTHPLNSYVYFVHGYFGSDEGFGSMKSYLRSMGVESRYGVNRFKNFSYWEPYWELYGDDFDTWGDFMWEMHSSYTVTDYADDFANRLLDEHENEHGVQIDIVAHSLGGLITREMLRNWHQAFGYYGIKIGRVITLGTPHLGTNIASGNIGAEVIIHVSEFYGNPNWQSPLFSSLIPESPMITTLNADPLSYSADIEWCTVAATDSVWGYIASYVHGDIQNDLIVAKSRAHLSYAIQANFAYTLFEPTAHNLLVIDSQHRTDGLLDTLLLGGIDTDNDGLLDIQEEYWYHTDPLNPDSDNDGLSDEYEINPNPYVTNPLEPDSDFDTLNDFDEIMTHGSNPLTSFTDGDILSDAQEVAWGYDPDNTNDPINAQALTYSAWQVNGVTGYVRANHYAAMDYVKVYVKYKNSYGQWTGNMFVGTDYTPTYYGDYYKSWSLLSGYIQMLVTVQAFDSANHYLGCDTQYVTLPGSGGGGKPGGDPVPE